MSFRRTYYGHILSDRSKSGGDAGEIWYSEIKRFNCGSKCHIENKFYQKSDAESPEHSERPTNRFPSDWVSKTPDNVTKKDTAKATTTKKSNQYKCCTQCNNYKGSWKFHWNTGHSILSNYEMEGGGKIVCIQYPSATVSLVKDKEEDR